jgi:hypothetical protein
MRRTIQCGSTARRPKAVHRHNNCGALVGEQPSRCGRQDQQNPVPVIVAAAPLRRRIVSGVVYQFGDPVMALSGHNF